MTGSVGTISQRPPAFSAVKVAGRRAYAVARAGETVTLTPREVTFHSLELASWDDTDPERPIAIVDVVCSAGAYVRALARDLGESLGSAAYLGALMRTSSGPFDLNSAIPLDTIRTAAAESPAGLLPLLLPIDAGLEDFPEVVLTVDEAQQVARGQFVKPTGGLPGPAERYRLRGPDGALVAIASPSGGNRLAPDKVFVSPASAAAAPA